LQQAGYRTGHFGKWHLSHDTIPDAPPVREYGFDESAVYCGPPPHADHETHMEAAIDFIKSSRNRPFFVNVWLHETHVPHFPPKDSLSKYAGLNNRQRVYAAVIEEGDRKVGRILQTLRDLQLDDRTLVIFSSDNGPEWTGGKNSRELRGGLGTYFSVGETGQLRGRKRSLYEGGVRTPFIVRWPGHVPAGVKNESTVIAAVDILPTLCAAAGVAVPEDLESDGENVLPALEGKQFVRTKPIYWEWRGPAHQPELRPRLAVREGDWKLLVAPDDGRIELYHLAIDAKEQRNLADSEPERTRRLREMAIAWQSTLPKVPAAECISKLNRSHLNQ
jgi:N-acetylgalactosamine-6-sulfatase